MPHLRDERGSRVQLRRAITFAATGSLGHDPHDLVALQHARGALDGGAVGRVALDGKRAHARQHLAHQAVRVAEQVLAPEEAHPLRGPSGQVHKRHVEERRMVADDHHPGLVLETAQTLAVVDPVAEADLEHESQEAPDEVAGPVRHLLLVGRAAQRHIPHLLVRKEQAHRQESSWSFIRSARVSADRVLVEAAASALSLARRAREQMSSMTSSM